MYEMIYNKCYFHSDNVRVAQRAICALKRKIAHYYWYKCVICASILVFLSVFKQKNAHLRSKVAHKNERCCAILAPRKILTQSLLSWHVHWINVDGLLGYGYDLDTSG